MKYLKMLLGCDMYIYLNRFSESSQVLMFFSCFFHKSYFSKLLNAFNIILLMNNTYKNNP